MQQQDPEERVGFMIGVSFLISLIAYILILAVIKLTFWLF